MLAAYNDSVTIKQDLKDAEFLIIISQITVNVIHQIIYLISREIKQRFQELLNSLKR
jgi:hypothetical protein